LGATRASDLSASSAARACDIIVQGAKNGDHRVRKSEKVP
jgi:hypothetical protein